MARVPWQAAVFQSLRLAISDLDEIKAEVHKT